MKTKEQVLKQGLKLFKSMIKDDDIILTKNDEKSFLNELEWDYDEWEGEYDGTDNEYPLDDVVSFIYENFEFENEY